MATLSITAESTVNLGETIDSNKFQQKLQQQLEELQKQQIELQNQLSATSSPLHQSPVHRQIKKETLENGNSDTSKEATVFPTSSDVSKPKQFESSNCNKNHMTGYPSSRLTLAEVRSIWLEKNNFQQQVKQLRRQLKQLQKSREFRQSPSQDQALGIASDSSLAVRSLVEDQPISTDSESCYSEKISMRSFGPGENGRLTIAQVVERGATGSLESMQEKVKKGKRTEDDELPAQGPINREPEEKLFPYKRNSILSL